MMKKQLANVVILRIGRHFRVPGGKKIIVGRNEVENLRLEGLAKEDDLLLTACKVPGPNVLIKGEPNEKDMEKAVGLMIRYSDYDPDKDPQKTGLEVALISGGEEQGRRFYKAPENLDIDELRLA